MPIMLCNRMENTIKLNVKIPSFEAFHEPSIEIMYNSLQEF
jgi:hypothetical protein